MLFACLVARRIAPIFTRLVNFCWTLFRGCLLLAVAAAVGVGGYLYLRLDDEIRRQVERRLAEHYVDLEVQVGRARFEPDRGIAIYDIEFWPQHTATEPILRIDELYLAGNLRIEELIADRLNIAEIHVRGATLHAIRASDGKWNVKSLLPLPQLSEELPLVRVEDAALIVADATDPSTTRTLPGIDLALTPVDREATASRPVAKRFLVAGMATGLPAVEMRIEGEVGTNDADYDLTVKAVGYEVTTESLAMLPWLDISLLRGADVSGRADIGVKVSRASAEEPMRWSAAVQLARGRIAHPALPEPLSDLSFSGTADSARLRVERLNCRCGPGHLALAGERTGWTQNAPLALAARVQQFALNDRWQALLPESIAGVWQRFQPVGVVDAELQLTFDGQQWRPRLSANCRDVSLTDAAKFPYPLEQTTGRVSYEPAGPNRPDRLVLDLTGVGGGRPVRIEAELSHLERPKAPATRPGIDSGHPLGWVEISGTDIPLHEQLLAAMPAKAEELVRSLRAQGAVDFCFRAEWNELAQARADVTHEIRLKDCSVHFEQFPYPLRGVQGLVTQHGGDWTIHDVTGRGWNDFTEVVCRGTCAPRGDGFASNITVQAANAALDDHLKLALPSAAQQAWEELRPQGRVDFTVHTVCDPQHVEPTISIVARPRDRSVSIEPARFPYRLEQVDGVATYVPGKVQLRNLQARHDGAAYSAAAGTWESTPAGWQLLFTGVNADRLAPHHDLLAALPARMQRAIERLEPSGTFSVYNSSVKLASAKDPGRITADWDVHLNCHQARLSGEVPIQSITGGVHLVGRHDGVSTHTSGDVDFDSLVWKDVQLTKIRGPLWIDPIQCLLGEAAAQKRAQPPRRITAEAYGGSLAANVEFQHENNPAYKLELALGGANLARFANERLGGPRNMGGTVSGRLHLTGAGRSTQSMQGAGTLNVVDANIYELPVLVAMLKVLKIRAPDTTAFNRCEMQFAIQGEHIHFDKLNLLGDAVSLYGKGDSHFDRRLDLVFYTLPEPANLPIPLWKTIAGQVSQQALQLKVVGTWDDAEVQPQTLPGFNQVLEQIQASAATMAPSTATRDGIGMQR